MRRGTRIAALAGGTFVLAACAAPIAGSAGPVPISSMASSTAEAKPSPRLAPQVKVPLDARGFTACSLLTPAQLAKLNLDASTARPMSNSSVESCAWSYMNDPGNVGGVQLSTHPTLPALDGIYLLRGTTAVFEPTEIAGHPAVRADSGGAFCMIYVGIADYQGVAVGADAAGRPRADACAPSRRMAEMILSNLPPLR